MKAMEEMEKMDMTDMNHMMKSLKDKLHYERKRTHIFDPSDENGMSMYKRFMPMWVKDKHMSFNQTSGQGKSHSFC